MTVVTAFLAVVLVLSETVSYLKPSTREWITVDRSFGQKLEINVDVLFPSTHCQCKSDLSQGDLLVLSLFLLVAALLCSALLCSALPV